MVAFVPPAELWEATTAVLEVAADADRVMQRGLTALCTLLGADRADGGQAVVGQRTYSPRWTVATGSVAMSYELPMDDPVIRQVLATPETFVVHDIREEIGGSATGELMSAIDTRAIAVRRLERDADGMGFVCVDWVGRAADVSREQVELLDVFVTKVLSPLLRAAPVGPQPGPDPLAVLTAAELEVCRLAVEGHSYREIASRRNTSVHTVGHQLSAARRKLEVPNTAALATLLAAAG